MVFRANPISSNLGRLVVIALGGVYIALGGGLLVAEVSQGRALSNVLIVALFVAIPRIILLYGGYRLPGTGIQPRFYRTVAVWCLGGIGLMLVCLGLYQFEPAQSITDPIRGVLVLTAFGSVAGFGVGNRDAIAKTRSIILEERNRQLERTEQTLQETVDELEAVNEKLTKSNVRLEQFAYIVSHDLQEPLRMTTSYLLLLKDRQSENLDADGTEFVGLAFDATQRMRGVIDELLEFSRVETDEDAFEPVDLNEVLTEVQTDLEGQISETDARVEIQTLPRVVGDRNQLGHVFQTLVSNALEYSGDEPPRVYVIAERTAGPETTISVRDEGIGIHPEDTDRIFEVFDRLHAEERYSDVGIGLALCKRIVERHDGERWVESDSGQGSTFSFTLPTVDEEER